MKRYMLFLCLLTCFSFSNTSKNLQRKVISDSEFDYSFHVSINEQPKLKYSKFYFWYKSGEIHSSQGDSSGDLLHGEYTKSYKSNNLAELGVFNKGLKNKIWKKWYKNGQLYEIANWKNGIKIGKYLQFSEEGDILIQGNYKDNNKHGVWVNQATNDTLYFKKGVKIGKPKKYTKKPFVKRLKSFFKNLFKKKEKNNLKKDSTAKKRKKIKSKK